VQIKVDLYIGNSSNPTASTQQLRIAVIKFVRLKILTTIIESISNRKKE